MGKGGCNGSTPRAPSIPPRPGLRAPARAVPSRRRFRRAVPPAGRPLPAALAPEAADDNNKHRRRRRRPPQAGLLPVPAAPSPPRWPRRAAFPGPPPLSARLRAPPRRCAPPRSRQARPRGVGGTRRHRRRMSGAARAGPRGECRALTGTCGLPPPPRSAPPSRGEGGDSGTGRAALARGGGPGAGRRAVPVGRATKNWEAAERGSRRTGILRLEPVPGRRSDPGAVAVGRRWLPVLRGEQRRAGRGAACLPRAPLPGRGIL